VAAGAQGREADLPGLPVQYADYAAWQRRWVAGELLREQAEYWKTTLAGAPELLELPTDRPRPARQDHAGGTVRIDLGEELAAGLKALGQRRGTTLFMTLLAGWAAVLGRLSGQDDVVVGTPSANRGRAEIEGLIGFFVNTLALRVELSGSPTVAELLEQVRARSLGAQRNQDIPFEQVVELVQPVRSLAHTPLFQVIFAWQSAAEGRLELPGLSAGGVGPASQAMAKFDLSLALEEAGGRITGSVTYATALFERATVERWLGYLRRVLEAMAADDLRAVDALPLLPGAERRRVLEKWSASGAAETPGPCIHQLFEAQAERTPDAVAVVFGEEALSYAALDRSANRLARRLRTLGVGPEARVGICVERGPEMVVGLLGVLKAGGAYVPLDPQYPPERLAFMLADARVAVLLTQAELAARFECFCGEVALVESSPSPGLAPSGLPDAGERWRTGEGPAVTPDHLAYVIYTSGSTGQPKGTEVPHRAIPGFFRGVDYARFDREQVLLQHSSVSWDALTLELWPALLTGGTCVLYPGRSAEAALLGEQLRAHGVTTLWLTSAYFNLVADSCPEILAGVSQLMVGGEAVSVPHVTRVLELHPELRVVNGYGPSECTVFAACYPVPRGFDAPALPIGRPVGDRRVYLLDRLSEPVPVGAPGELCIGGPAVARGYLNRPGLTAERFVPDPFGEPGARLYRTGDLCRWRYESAEVRECASAPEPREDPRTSALPHSRTAVLEFAGRRDAQVKIRGFRIEPGEVEARLAEHPGVHEAVVLVREDAPGDRRLVAYVVGEDTAGADVLRTHLAERLPEYMVQAAYVRLDALPLTPRGKLDRRALPAPDAGAYAAREYEAPMGKVEQALAGIWAELLKVERVGRGDDFFMLVGHSLLAVQMISRVRQAVDVELALGAVFETPVLSALADRILDLRLARFDPETLARLARLVREPGAQPA